MGSCIRFSPLEIDHLEHCAPAVQMLIDFHERHEREWKAKDRASEAAYHARRLRELKAALTKLIKS